LKGGYANRILRVNLTKGSITKEKLGDDLLETYLGGKGLAARLLYDELNPRVDPLGQENKLFFATGPLTGTIVPASPKYDVSFKSPLTGVYAESQSGGSFAVALKKAGYDALVIEGRAESPVYLHIDDEDVEIRAADHLWGFDTFETDDVLKSELGDDDFKIASIGPAGERLVRFACIKNDYWRSAGRCGAGAVMGSKKLKAIAVKGTGSITVAEEGDLRESVREILERIKTDPLTSKNYPVYGTAAVVNSTNIQGVFPTRYWHKSFLEGYENVNAEALRSKILVKNWACYGCPISCGKYCEVKEGPYAGTKGVGPEFETIYSFGGLCEIDSLEAIAKFNEICNKAGLDTISAGNVVAFAMDAYERGALKSDLPIRFGDPDVVIRLLEMISKRDGVGNLLAEGVKRASENLGVSDLAIHVKGLEPAGYDPRGLKGMGLAYAVSPRGACHLRAVFYALELSTHPTHPTFDRLSMGLEKVPFMIDWENRFAVMDSMVLCRFGRTIYDWTTLAKVYSQVTGVKVSESLLKEAGERIVTLARMFNIREGLSRKDDTLPQRFFNEPVPSGPSQGQSVDRNGFEKMLEKYYEIRGWDKEGKPTGETLTKLRLK